jgi:hypothetical protein
MFGTNSNAYDVAISIYGLECELSRVMIVFEPSNLNWQHDAASCNARIGWVLTKEGRTAEALSYLNRAKAISEDLVRAEPKNPDWQADAAAARKLLDSAHNVARGMSTK